MTLFGIGPMPCAICQIPHATLAICLLFSAIKSFEYRAHALIMFHAIAGAILLFLPQLIHEPTIAGGSFDDLHILLQRYTASFHIGFALFHYANQFLYKPVGIVNPVIMFSKALIAGTLLLNKLITAYLLYEQRARGQHVSQNFLGCTLMVDGIWLAVELHSLFYSSKLSLTAEIELMCARTRRWIDFGQTGLGTQRALFWADSALSFLAALFQFAFSEQILKIMIRREYIIGGLHEMYAREFAVHCLLVAILSLVAPFQFSLSQQRNYAAQRILNQSLIFLLNCFGHFQMGIYASAHIVPFVLSFFHCALLLVVGQRICGEQAAEANEIGGNSSTGSGITTATVTLRSQQSTTGSPKNK